MTPQEIAKKMFLDSYKMGIKKSPVDFVIPQKLLVPNQVNDAVFPNSLKNGATKSAINALSIGIGQHFITIDNVGDLNPALRALNSIGGGTLNLIPGIYQPKEDIEIFSNIAISGNTARDTIIDFNGTALHMFAAGTNIYTTGTITSITSGVLVTGSGTSWLANVIPGESQLFLANRWHEIAVVTDNTHLILAEAYSGPTVMAGTAYRIAIPVNDIRLEFIQLTGSTGTAFDIIDVRSVEQENTVIVDNNVGFDYENVSEIVFSQSNVVANTDDGYRMTNCGFGNILGLNASGNGGNGAVLNNLRTMPFTFSSNSANAEDGFNCTTLVDCLFNAEASSNGGQGFEFVATCDTVYIYGSLIRANTSDGIKLTATCDNFTLGSSLNISGNGGFGINIAAATDDNTLILGCHFAGNSSGAVDDNGTGTLIRSNIGQADN